MTGSSACTAASLAPMTTRPRRTSRSSRTASSASAARVQQARGVVLQEPAGLGQGAVARRAVEQPLPELFFEPPDGLADGRLGPVELLGRPREAALGGDRRENGEVLQLHGLIITIFLYNSKNYKFDYHCGKRLQRVLSPEDRMKADRLTIFDTTLRDGEQAPGFSMRIDEKLRMARQLAALGVDIIEAGFPIASDADAEAVRTVSTHIKGPVIAALARCTPRRHRPRRLGARAAPTREAHPHLHRHLRPAPRAQAADVARRTASKVAMAAVRHARTFTDDVQFSAEDATRSDPDFLCHVVEAVIQAGAKTINLPDTVGYSTPDEIAVVLPPD